MGENKAPPTFSPPPLMEIVLLPQLPSFPSSPFFSPFHPHPILAEEEGKHFHNGSSSLPPPPLLLLQIADSISEKK